MNIIIKGAGDIATGVAIRLLNVGFSVTLLEVQKPTTVRRTVAFSQAVFDGRTEVENYTAVLCKEYDEIKTVQNNGQIPLLIDEHAKCLGVLKPDVVVDAIIAKKNIGTKIGDAQIVVGLGPGFKASVDCHAVIETNRGHNLGRVIYDGEAEPNTGVPGDVGGQSGKRILRAPCNGEFKGVARIGDLVCAGDVVAMVGDSAVVAKIDGMVRGMLQDGIFVKEGIKAGDIDPRGEKIDFHTVSDKARSIGGGVLEAILHLRK